MGDVWNEIRNGDPLLILLAIGVTMLTYALRAYRWQYMVRVLGPTHFGAAFRATVIGFAANFLLPGRAGEFVRCWLLSRREPYRVAGPTAATTGPPSISSVKPWQHGMVCRPSQVTTMSRLHRSHGMRNRQDASCEPRSGSILTRAPPSSIDKRAPRSMLSRCARSASATMST